MCRQRGGWHTRSTTPKVANNAGFANMLSELVEANSAPAKRLAAQFDAECAKALSTSNDDQPAPSRKRATPSAPAPTVPDQPTPLIQPSTFHPGMDVVVATSAWPAWKCAEHGGAGWAATVRRVASTACRVSFTVARTRDGRPYADAVVPKQHLMVPASPASANIMPSATSTCTSCSQLRLRIQSHPPTLVS